MSAPRYVGDAWIAPDHVAAITDSGSPYEPTTRILLAGGHTVTVPGTVDETVAALFGDTHQVSPKVQILAELSERAAERARRRAAELARTDGARS